MKNRSDRSLGLFFEAWCVVSFSIFKLLRSLHDFVGFFLFSLSLHSSLAFWSSCVFFFTQFNFFSRFVVEALGMIIVRCFSVTFRTNEWENERVCTPGHTNNERTTRNDRKYKLNNNLNVLWGHSHFSFCSKWICRCVLLLRSSFHTAFFGPFSVRYHESVRSRTFKRIRPTSIPTYTNMHLDFLFGFENKYLKHIFFLPKWPRKKRSFNLKEIMAQHDHHQSAKRERAAAKRKNMETPFSNDICSSATHCDEVNKWRSERAKKNDET